MTYDPRLSAQHVALSNIRTVTLLEELGLLDDERLDALGKLTRPAGVRFGAPDPGKDPAAATAFALEAVSALAEALVDAVGRIAELEKKLVPAGREGR